MAEEYITLVEGGTGEIIEKKSRFIGQIAPVSTEEDAFAFIESVRKKHYAARHNCYAFSIGDKQPLLRFSDDGEPQGTAGKPILEVINGSGIHNICIVVTRYFGGTLLGTGGLVRAYTDASKEALRACTTRLVQMLRPLHIRCDYSDVGKLQYILAENKIDASDICFEADVKINVNVPVDFADELVAKMNEATGARADIETGEAFFG